MNNEKIVLAVLVILACAVAVYGALNAGITGYAAKCIDGPEGARCGGQLFPYKPADGCPGATVETCTNLCEIRRAMTGQPLICPTVCEIYCLPPQLVEKVKGTPKPEKECTNSRQCVPATCCHPSECVNVNEAPDCTDVSCTLDCVPGTMDCGQGHCECVQNQCEAIITQPEYPPHLNT